MPKDNIFIISSNLFPESNNLNHWKFRQLVISKKISDIKHTIITKPNVIKSNVVDVD